MQLPVLAWLLHALLLQLTCLLAAFCVAAGGGLGLMNVLCNAAVLTCLLAAFSVAAGGGLGLMNVLCNAAVLTCLLAAFCVAAGGGLGLMNVASRFLGGAASDLAAGLRGMRGRLWVLQAVLLLEGVFCLLVGIVHDFLPATVSALVMRQQQLVCTSVQCWPLRVAA
jgi:hypothetical protein